MARSVTEDPYHNFRFQLVDPSGAFIRPEAGFTTASMPEVTVAEQEYREGTDIYTRKYPGYPEVGQVTLNRGIFRRTSDFFEWIEKVIFGGVDYVADVLLYEFHIADAPGDPFNNRLLRAPSRITRIKEAWATTVKPTSDKDASGADISLEELTLSVQEIQPEFVGDLT